MDEDWSNKTQVGFVIKKSGDTRAFQVHTRSSQYVLGFFDIGGPRPFAIMRGLSNGVGHEIDLRDSDPRIGDKSLFDTPVKEWLGERLDLAGTKTSPVTSAVEATNPVHSDTLIRTLMQPAVAVSQRTEQPASAEPKAKRQERPETPYPENCVEYVESMASILRKLASDRRTLRDIGSEAHLVARLKVALMNARVASEDIARAFE